MEFSKNIKGHLSLMMDRLAKRDIVWNLVRTLKVIFP